MNWIYEHDVNNTARFTLGEYQYISDKTLICFGINPSTATPNNLDNTLKKVGQNRLKGASTRHGSFLTSILNYLRANAGASLIDTII